MTTIRKGYNLQSLVWHNYDDASCHKYQTKLIWVQNEFLISKAQFSQTAEFRADPKNLPFAAEFPCFCRIMWNLTNDWWLVWDLLDTICIFNPRQLPVLTKSLAECRYPVNNGRVAVFLKPTAKQKQACLGWRRDGIIASLQSRQHLTQMIHCWLHRGQIFKNVKNCPMVIDDPVQRQFLRSKSTTTIAR